MLVLNCCEKAKNNEKMCYVPENVNVNVNSCWMLRLRRTSPSSLPAVPESVSLLLSAAEEGAMMPQLSSLNWLIALGSY